MKKITFILLTIIHSTVFGQTIIKVGQKAPQITVTDWILNIPKDKNLANKFVVLEFWATWCGPCVAAVPHMNELQAKFKNPNLYFISITDESKEKVERTLKRIDFKSIVVSDVEQKTQIQYGDGKTGIGEIPLTVLIDDKGYVSWIGDPQRLTESTLNDFIMSDKNNKLLINSTTIEPLKVEIVSEKDDFMELITNKEILYKLEFKKSKSKYPHISKGGLKLFSYTATNFIDIYADLFGQAKNNILMPDSIKNEKFDLTYKNMKGNGQDLLEIESHILKTVGLKKTKLSQNLPVHEVLILDNKLLEKTLDEDFSAKSDAKDKLIFTSYTLNDLIKELNAYSTERFSISTNNKVEGKFDFIIEVKSTDKIIKSLESYGFKVHNIEKEIEVWQLANEK